MFSRQLSLSSWKTNKEVISRNLLLILSLFLVIFIPLWPKIPLIQIIPGYIVRVRLEDIFVALTGLVWLRQVWKSKVRWRTPLNKSMFIYILVGLISLISALFVIKTIPILLPHVAKAFLHLLRYMEYFSIFFFVFASIKKPFHVKLFLSAFFVTVVIATFYGVGQKYGEWPVYSTMNMEFSSGEPLELISQSARVQSTFAGHYDFAIYMGLILPIILTALILAKRRDVQFALGVIFLMGLWSLIVSGLRSAFASYLVSAMVVIILLAFRQKTRWFQVKWAVIRLVAVYCVTGVMFIVFGNNLAALLGHAITGVLLPQAHQSSVDQTIISQYVLPVPKNEVINGQVPVGTKPETLSGCALQREVSLCIRLESLWPQAIRGFQRNPVLGSGYSTLNKRDFNHLSEADGVDNNYLRILGETGLLGFIAFFSIIFIAIKITAKRVSQKDSLVTCVAVSFLASVIGLLGNALLIDVFAASKVAFSFWAVTGMTLGYLTLQKNSGKLQENLI